METFTLDNVLALSINIKYQPSFTILFSNYSLHLIGFAVDISQQKCFELFIQDKYFWFIHMLCRDKICPRRHFLFFLPLVPGCPTAWDQIRCWYRAEVGQVVSVSCANVSQLFADNDGKWLQFTWDRMPTCQSGGKIIISVLICVFRPSIIMNDNPLTALKFALCWTLFIDIRWEIELSTVKIKGWILLKGKKQNIL